MSEHLDYTYIAGLFDGDGSVWIHSAESHSARFHARVSITNTYLPILLSLQAQFGGRIYENTSARQRKKRIFSWHITNKVELCTFLVAICPHVVIKRSRVEYAIALASLVGPQGIKTSPDTLDEREALSAAITILNAEPPGTELKGE